MISTVDDGHGIQAAIADAADPGVAALPVVDHFEFVAVDSGDAIDAAELLLVSNALNGLTDVD